MCIALILLAAGCSKRMEGRDKLMEPVRDTSLLRDRVAMAMESAAHPVLVVLPPDRPARIGAIADFDVVRVINPFAAGGMASSIKAGLKAVPKDCLGTLMMPADMPNITADHLNLMIERAKAEPETILRAAGADGFPKSPTYLPRPCFPLFRTLQDDEGGRQVLQNYQGEIKTVPLDGPDPTFDLDTPEDWERWRTSQ